MFISTPTENDCRQVCAYAIERIGLAYDLKNITDLMRYLMPLPVPQPVPTARRTAARCASRTRW